MDSKENIKSESIFIPVNDTDTLHLKRFYSDSNGQPIFMVHGSIENGKIFYSSSGKGLAPYLALQGFDVFVADLRGRGESTPPIGKGSTHGLAEIIKEDLPAFIKKIQEIKGDVPQHWISHSWGGVHFLCYLARNMDAVNLASMVFYASKRKISIISFRRFYMIDFFWNFMSKIYTSIYGYLPATGIKMGSDNETIKSHRQTNDWVYSEDWIDWEDGFDYSTALKQLNLPPILSLTGEGDDVLGHPTDVKFLLKEIGDQEYTFRIIGKSTGYKHNYDHINILTHPDCTEDHFPEAVEWMMKHSEVEVKAEVG